MQNLYLIYQNYILASKFALIELKESFSNFKIFIISLIFGVFTISSIGLIAEAMKFGIKKNTKSFLGGDFELSRLQQPIEREIFSEFFDLSSFSEIIEMTSMIEGKDNSKTLVQLKIVDDKWPLVGEVVTKEEISVYNALKNNGAILDSGLSELLNLKVGEKFKLGTIEINYNSTLVSDPERSTNFANFAPKIIINHKTLTNSKLSLSSSFVRYKTRILLKNTYNYSNILNQLNNKLKETNIKIRSKTNFSPNLNSIIDRTKVYLILVALSSLLIGGLGVSNSAKNWINSRIETIAIYKSLGASSNLIFSIYIIQILLLALCGIVIGIILSLLSPIITSNFIKIFFNFHIEFNFYPTPIFIATGFGFLITLIFSIIPLSRSKFIKASSIFRKEVMSNFLYPGHFISCTLIFLLISIFLLMLISTKNFEISLFFILVVIGIIFVLFIFAELFLLIINFVPEPSYLPIKFALNSIRRRNSPFKSIILAFGLGICVLIIITQSQSNLNNQIFSRANIIAPDWFFINIQSSQMNEFSKIIENNNEIIKVQKSPMLRGRIIKINGKNPKNFKNLGKSEWILRSDRAITWTKTLPKEAKLVSGKWWDEDENKTLISISHQMLNDFGLSLGDKITFNILGREIETIIYNTREVDWQNFGLNFLFIMSPKILDKAPHTWVVTTKSKNQESAQKIKKKLVNKYPNISSLSVKDAIEKGKVLLNLLISTIEITAYMTIFTGLIVLSGIVINSENNRLNDFLILKILGISKKEIVLTWLFEYFIMGVWVSFLAFLLGSFSTWVFFKLFLKTNFYFNFLLVIYVILFTIIITTFLGLFGASLTLTKKNSYHLRENF